MDQHKARPGTVDAATAKSGYAIRLALGKEWWVSDDWGLGLTATYNDCRVSC